MQIYLPQQLLLGLRINLVSPSLAIVGRDFHVLHIKLPELPVGNVRVHGWRIVCNL